jgi:Ca-activated chloride channel family protein
VRWWIVYRDWKNLELALRVYGHTKRYPPQDCDDTRLEVPFGRGNNFAIKKRLEEISPSGTTPIARSLEACGGDFPKEPGEEYYYFNYRWN